MTTNVPVILWSLNHTVIAALLNPQDLSTSIAAAPLLTMLLVLVYVTFVQFFCGLTCLQTQSVLQEPRKRVTGFCVTWMLPLEIQGPREETEITQVFKLHILGLGGHHRIEDNWNYLAQAPNFKEKKNSEGRRERRKTIHCMAFWLDALWVCWTLIIRIQCTWRTPNNRVFPPCNKGLKMLE